VGGDCLSSSEKLEFYTQKKIGKEKKEERAGETNKGWRPRNERMKLQSVASAENRLSFKLELSGQQKGEPRKDAQRTEKEAQPPYSFGEVWSIRKWNRRRNGGLKPSRRLEWEKPKETYEKDSGGREMGTLKNTGDEQLYCLIGLTWTKKRKMKELQRARGGGGRGDADWRWRGRGWKGSYEECN